MVNRILNIIKDVFETKDVKYYCEEQRGRIGANFPDSVMTFRVESEQVTFKMVFKEDIPQEKRKDVLEYLNQVNCILREGHMEMDEDGSVQFRICVDISKEQDMSEYRILGLMGKGVHMESTFYEGMYQVAKGIEEPRKAIEKAVHAARKRSA